jgi:hypothetical protein
VGQLLTVLTVGGVHDLHVLAGMAQHGLLSHEAVEHDDVGGREQVAGPQGEQPRVAGAGPDEGDA